MAWAGECFENVDVLICTFRRRSLGAALDSLAAQDLPSGMALRVIVADNDDTASAKALVRQRQARLGLDILYLHAPAGNISIARNACLDAARAPWVAFLDDDETAPPDWLGRLAAAARAQGADAVFGPARALYPPAAPAWMRRGDYHSNIPVHRNGKVTTGHTCNALLRWGGAPWRDVRFDPGRGRSGGEDTAFFFELHRRGARFAISFDAEVTEEVDPARLRFSWILRRKFRAGQSHTASAGQAPLAKARLALSALGKAAVCAAAALACAWDADRRRFWSFRGALHCGVIAGCLALPEPQSYGR